MIRYFIINKNQKEDLKKYIYGILDDICKFKSIYNEEEIEEYKEELKNKNINFYNLTESIEDIPVILDVYTDVYSKDESIYFIYLDEQINTDTAIKDKMKKRIVAINKNKNKLIAFKAMEAKGCLRFDKNTKTIKDYINGSPGYEKYIYLALQEKSLKRGMEILMNYTNMEYTIKEVALTKTTENYLVIIYNSLQKR